MLVLFLKTLISISKQNKATVKIKSNIISKNALSMNDLIFLCWNMTRGKANVSSVNKNKNHLPLSYIRKNKT